MPTAAATIDTSGLLTAVSAGTVQVKASVTGSNVMSGSVTVEIVAAVTAGRRVMVIDQPNGAPLANVKVNGCDIADCTTPTQVTTGADGIALFPALGTGPASFTAVSQEVRTSDGLPAYARVSVIGTSAADVYLPLEVNPVHEASGFSGSVSFEDVQTSGTYWAGFVAGSAADLPSFDVASLLGESFNIQIPGINQSVPVPGPLVVYTSPGFGIPSPIKAKALGLSQAGTPRNAIAFAGRTNLNQVLTLRSTALLSYLGAFNFSVSLDNPVPALSRVPDATDVDSDGLCSNSTRCPMGSEEVPDYAHFAPLTFTPRSRAEAGAPKWWYQSCPRRSIR